MSITKLVPSLLAVAAFTGGCASAAAGGPGSASDAAVGESTAGASRRDRDVITLQELSDPALRAMSVLEVIRTLRPIFLSVRGKNSHSDAEAGRVHASIDFNAVVPLEELRNVHVTGVVEILYLAAGPAMQKFGGAAHEGPVIVVRTH